MTIRTLMRMLAAGLVGALLAACAAGSNAPLEQQGSFEAGEYQLGSGDQVRISVFGQDQLSGEFAVDGGGYIAMPLVGEIEARGKTVRGLEEAIATRLSDGYVRDPRVSVEVLTFRPFYIIGEVNKPGQYSYVNGMTAVTAVALAGGYTYRGNQEYVLVTRGNDPEKIERRAPVNTPVRPDDVIRIPERFF